MTHNFVFIGLESVSKNRVKLFYTCSKAECGIKYEYEVDVPLRSWVLEHIKNHVNAQFYEKYPCKGEE